MVSSARATFVMPMSDEFSSGLVRLHWGAPRGVLPRMPDVPTNAPPENGCSSQPSVVCALRALYFIRLQLNCGC
jgi:hypothetical protein